MKTLIDWAIVCGNENDLLFRNENEHRFENENQTGNENENETSRAFENENEVEMKANITTIQPKNERGNELVLHTKFGTAKPNTNGYYRITSGREGNNMKFLHRLVFEDYHKCTLLPEAQIHHIDGDKNNNCILNLELVYRKDHINSHNNSRNTTGFYRVSKSPCNQCKQGFIYRYQYYDENNNKKAIFSTTLEGLEAKVKVKRLEWRKL